MALRLADSIIEWALAVIVFFYHPISIVDLEESSIASAHSIIESAATVSFILIQYSMNKNSDISRVLDGI